MSAPTNAAVILPTFNGEAAIEQALASVEAAIHATSHDVAAVVVDDGSSDDTVAVVERFALGSPIRVEIVRHHKNRGTGAARNTGVAGIEAAAYLFLDQDDEYLPDHIDRCLQALHEHRRCDYVRTGVVLDREVHPAWPEIIADSLVQTICVRHHAHRLVGGFIDDPAVAAVGCDDVYYRRLLGRYLRGRRIDADTVRFRERAGNSFERQWERKFSRPPEEGERTLSGARLEALPEAEAAFATRQREVERRVRRLTGR